MVTYYYTIRLLLLPSIGKLDITVYCTVPNTRGLKYLESKNCYLKNRLCLLMSARVGEALCILLTIHAFLLLCKCPMT